MRERKERDESRSCCCAPRSGRRRHALARTGKSTWRHGGMALGPMRPMPPRDVRQIRLFLLVLSAFVAPTFCFLLGTGTQTQRPFAFCLMSLARAVLRPLTFPIRSRAISSLSQPARSASRPHQLRQQQSLLSPYCRPYSSSPPNTPSQYNRSQFKILPFLAIIGLGSGSYVFLVKSRTGARKPQPESKSPDQQS